MLKIFVASNNPVKVNAIVIAVSETYPEAKVQGLAVESGVSDQPMTDEETLKGSINRARAVQQLATKNNLLNADEHLFVGAEGGVCVPAYAKSDRELWSTVWITVLDEAGKTYSSNGARFKLPEIISDGILAGKELGHVIGALFSDMELKRKSGAIGIVTKNFIDRTEEYSIIAKLALGLWYGRDWQKKLKK